MNRLDNVRIPYEEKAASHKSFTADLIALLTSTSTSNDDLISCMKHIGNVVYIVGGSTPSSATPEGGNCFSLVDTILPHLLSWLKRSDNNHVFLIQLLRTLALVCHCNRQAQSMFEMDHRACIKLRDLILGTRDQTTCRCACEVLHHLVADNPPLLQHWAGDDEMITALESADTDVTPWKGWPCNLADHLLKMFGVRPIQ